MAALPLPSSGHRHKGNDAMLPPKLILSPIDFSDSSHAALDVAADFATRFGAELLLVHVMPAMEDLPKSVSVFKEGKYDESLDDAAAKRLSDLAATLAQKNVKARTEVGTADDVGMELVRSAEHNHADLIIIATHGMTGWRNIPFGSVAEKVVKQASCPVLVLRANAMADADAGGEKKAASSAGASD
jgi:nucleotide-binding universal stress UspA family protein